MSLTSQTILALSVIVQDIIGPPFEWVYIPSGTVTLKDLSSYAIRPNGQVEVASFLMAKYPITNGQFQAFLDHPDGYHNPQWWEFSDWVKEWKQQHPTPKLRDFGGEDLLPRTSIAWYESVAFAGWLNAQLPSPPQGGVIRLPSEAQWQHAAQCNTGRPYPWGEGIDPSYANYEASGIGQTTPVTDYPKGVTPEGVMGLAGNVWEWCLSAMESEIDDFIPSDVRAIRGGSWEKSSEKLHLSIRNWSNAGFGSHVIGLRCSYMFES